MNPTVDYWGLQEAVSQPKVLDFLESILNVTYNPAWSNSKRNTGTLNASKTSPLDYVGVVTYVSEPLSDTPKSFIVSDYDFGCSENVRIINTHMINFLIGDGYKSQLMQMEEYLDNYSGPLIVLGDFNNWNWFRTNTLLNWTEDLNLNLAYETHYKINGLDHVFYRGLSLKSFKKVVVGLSDHEPVHAQFQCKN